MIPSRAAQARTATAYFEPRRILLAALLPAFVLLAGFVKAEEPLIKAHGISTFGDLKYDADFAHLDYVNPDAPKGGEISFAWSSGSFDSFHPYTRKGRSAVLSSIFFESMLSGTLDEVDSSYGLLAESIEYPEDKSYVIFTIRPEARFSDGTPVTAEDALFSYEILRDEGLPSFRASLPKTIESAEVLDEKRIKFVFNPESAKRDRIQSAGGLPVFSKASHENSGLAFDDSRLEPLVGSGPYVLDEVDVGQRTVFKLNPDYWGADLPINIGRNNFDKIRIEYYGDAIAAFEGFKAGNYTFRQESSSQNWATGYDFPALSREWVKKETLPDGTIAPGQTFAINLRREKFQDPRVREALGMMFNFDWTNAKLFYGLYKQIDGLWTNSDLAASGMPSEAELAILEPLRGQIPESVFTEEAYSLTPSSDARVLDRRKARQATMLLEEAGWEPGSDGLLRNADGQSLDIEFLNDSPLFDRIINPYVENLRAIGVNARLTRVDNAQATQRERDYDFDLVTTHYPMTEVPGSGLRQYFGSESANNSVFNIAGVSDPAVDSLIETVIDAETKEEMATATKALDRVLRAIKFRVPQWYNDSHWVAYYDMYEYPEVLPPYGLGFLDFWWFNQDKADALKAAGAY